VALERRYSGRNIFAAPDFHSGGIEAKLAGCSFNLAHLQYSGCIGRVAHDC
jgi:hypothetical protein